MCVMMKTYKRTVLITGATDGIGRQVALELSSNSDENFVIIHGRCKRKCEATVDYLLQENRLRPNIQQQQQFQQQQRRQHAPLQSATMLRPPSSTVTFRLRHASPDSAAGVEYSDVADYSDASSPARTSASNSTSGHSSPSNVDYVAADFAQASEVCRMAEEIKTRFPRLNTFVGCASVLVPRKMSSQNGNELTLQVNHLSHYILWNSLLPLLERNAPSRIVTVGSMLHSFNSIDWEDVNCEKGVYDKFLQYSRTKLMNHLATFYIHRLLFKHDKQFQVTANVVDADQQADRRLSRTYVNHFNALSASESHLNAHANGINTLVRIVENDAYSGMSGKYFDANGKEVRNNAVVGDVRFQDRLWEMSRTLCAAMNVSVAAANTTSTTNYPIAKIQYQRRHPHNHHASNHNHHHQHHHRQSQNHNQHHHSQHHKHSEHKDHQLEQQQVVVEHANNNNNNNADVLHFSA